MDSLNNVCILYNNVQCNGEKAIAVNVLIFVVF